MSANTIQFLQLRQQGYRQGDLLHQVTEQADALTRQGVQTTIAAFNDEVDRVSAQIGLIVDNVTTMGPLQSAQTQISTLEERVKNLQTSKEGLETSVRDEDKRLTDQKADRETLNLRLAALRTQLVKGGNIPSEYELYLLSRGGKL